MKPRLRRINGLWYCGTVPGARWLLTGPFVGLGYTPRQAYDDWKAQA